MVRLFELAGELAQRMFEIAHALAEIGDGRILRVFVLFAGGDFLIAVAEETGDTDIVRPAVLSVMRGHGRSRAKKDNGRNAQKPACAKPRNPAADVLHLASLDRFVRPKNQFSRILSPK